MRGIVERRKGTPLGYSVLAASHKILWTLLGVILMTEAIDYSKGKEEINIQKMQLSVTNLTPQFPHQTKENVKQEVSSRLFQILKNMIKVFANSERKRYDCLVDSVSYV